VSRLLEDLLTAATGVSHAQTILRNADRDLRVASDLVSRRETEGGDRSIGELWRLLTEARQRLSVLHTRLSERIREEREGEDR